MGIKKILKEMIEEFGAENGAFYIKLSTGRRITVTVIDDEDGTRRLAVLLDGTQLTYGELERQMRIIPGLSEILELIYHLTGTSKNSILQAIHEKLAEIRKQNKEVSDEEIVS